MSSLGAISSYCLAAQEMQVAMLKQQVQTEQAAIQILDSARTIPTSSSKGSNIDIQL